MKVQVTVQKLPKQMRRNDTEVMEPLPTISDVLFAFITAERPKRSSFAQLNYSSDQKRESNKIPIPRISYTRQQDIHRFTFCCALA